MPTLAVNSPTHVVDPTEVDNGWLLFLLAEDETPPEVAPVKLEPQFRVPALPVRTCPCPLSRVGVGWAGERTEEEVVLVAVLVVVEAVSEDVERE